MFVEDVAGIAVAAGRRSDDVAMDAVGPEAFSYEEMVRLIADAVGSRARLVHVSPGLAAWLSSLAGLVVRDVVVTRDEIEGLMAGLLVSKGPPTGHTRLSQWLKENAAVLGTRYASELRRHYR